VQNAFLVTAISENMGTNGGYSASTSLKLRGTAEGADRIMFNRDERAYSGPGSATVTCVGRVEIQDMVGETVMQSTPNGGWSNLTVTAGQAIVFKAEINEAPTVNGVPVPGTFNNIYQLRKGFRETLANTKCKMENKKKKFVFLIFLYLVKVERFLINMYEKAQKLCLRVDWFLNNGLHKMEALEVDTL
jgi:hypothetical protein